MKWLGYTLAGAGVLGIVGLTVYCFLCMADPEFNVRNAFYLQTWFDAWDDLKHRPLLMALLIGGVLFDLLAMAWLLTRKRDTRRGFGLENP